MPRIHTRVCIPSNEQTYVQLIRGSELPESTRDGRVLFAVKWGAHLLAFVCRDCSESSYCETHAQTWADWGVMVGFLARAPHARGRVVGGDERPLRVNPESSRATSE